MDLIESYTPMVVLPWYFMDLMLEPSDLRYRGVRFTFVLVLESLSYESRFVLPMPSLLRYFLQVHRRFDEKIVDIRKDCRSKDRFYRRLQFDGCTG